MKIADHISHVRLPALVFCLLGWYEVSRVIPETVKRVPCANTSFFVPMALQ